MTSYDVIIMRSLGAMCAMCGSAQVGHGEVGGFQYRVMFTRWLLWLAVERPWSALGRSLKKTFLSSDMHEVAISAT